MSISLFPSNNESAKTKEEEIYLQNYDVEKATKVCWGIKFNLRDLWLPLGFL